MVIPSGWEVYNFPKTLVKNKVGRNNQINSSEIKLSGEYPVIDQGQDYIAGYSDEKDKVYKPEQPLVVFGDHTRCFKYVDFPFIVGADGTKVIVPNTAIFNPRFFYFQLLNLHIPSRGYNRHFKSLKEQKILHPPISEQDNIAYILSQLQSVIEAQDKIIHTTTELKRALMQKLFTEGFKGEPQKETEIGLVPKSWDIKSIGDVAYVTKLAGFEYTKYVKYVEDGEVIGIRGINLKNGKLDLTNVKRIYRSVSESLQRSKLHIGDVVLSYVGTVGGVAVINEADKYHLAPNVAKLTSKNRNLLNPNFLAFYLLSDVGRTQLFMSVSKTSQPVISMARIRSLKICIPTIDDQQRIVTSIQILDRKYEAAERRRVLLEELFHSMLHHLITGQIRVNDLKLA